MTSAAQMGPTNLTLTVAKNTTVVIESNDGRFRTLGTEGNPVTQIHVLTNWSFEGDAKLESGDAIKFTAVIKPVPFQGMTSSNFPKSLPERMKEQLRAISNTMAPNVCSRPEQSHAWRETLNYHHDDRNYEVVIQYSR